MVVGSQLSPSMPCGLSQDATLNQSPASLSMYMYVQLGAGLWGGLQQVYSEGKEPGHDRLSSTVSICLACWAEECKGGDMVLGS